MPPKRTLIRPLIQELHAYVPGEQPKIAGLIKLNTNENPYPPAPAVLKAVKAAVDGRLRLYPDPTSQPLREALAKLHGCAPENIFVGNGSDECLACAVRTFVEPAVDMGIWRKRTHRSAATVQFFTPSYSLYPVLAAAHGATSNPVELNPDMAIPPVNMLRHAGGWDFMAALTFITTPNAPTGRGYTTRELDSLCTAMRGVVVLDEAYVDFAPENAAALALKHPHVLVARTFSKAYSLCFQRVGYFIGHPELIAALDKTRDSYNVNGLGQVAALETLNCLDYYKGRFQQIIRAREATAAGLEEIGFKVRPSQTNFLFVRPPGSPAQDWMAQFRDRKILVRWFAQPMIADSLRITIGTAEEMEALVKAAHQIAKALSD
jgi:histidinol-phosphate aminotransferase